MAGCDTCRRRKVKCDGRAGVCERCEKLRLDCVRDGPHAGISSASAVDSDFTQAGHKRLRTTAACVRCRAKKLKCDAQRPSCSLCLKKGQPCQYAGARPKPDLDSAPLAVNRDSDTNRPAPGHFGGALSSTDGSSMSPPVSMHEMDKRGSNASQAPRPSISSVRRGRTHSSAANDMAKSQPLADYVQALQSNQTGGPELPQGQLILAYLDAFLANIHPISCNNFLHPGSLCAGIHKAPQLLLLAICGSAAKFMPRENSRDNGAQWADQAKALIMKNTAAMSTLTISAIQFLALHDMHDGKYTSAWNLVGIAIRMALEMRLYEPQQSAPFLQQECRRRLLWAVYVSDLLFDNDQLQMDTELLLDVPLPCNLWNFTQGIPCKTLTLRELQSKVEDDAKQQLSNPCAFLIAILAIRRKILRYIRSSAASMDVPWMDGSLFAALRRDVETWRSNLPKNYSFIERHMYMFRVSSHLDLFLMIHAYYHQCCILLYGVFLPDSLEPNLEQTLSQAPPEFLQQCAEEFLLHAKEISRLVQRVLKAEPEHVFRDPWFSLCIWDSTCAQLTTIPWHQNDADGRADAAELLKANLKALQNTMHKIPLAEQIYYHCCAAIRHHGLQDSVGYEAELAAPSFNPPLMDITSALHQQRFCRRYLFFSTAEAKEATEWDELFAATTTAAQDADDHEEQAPRTTLQLAGSGLNPMASRGMESLAYGQPNLGATPDDVGSLWSADDLQWWQLQNPFMDPASFSMAADMGTIPQ